jgi:probable addiction module antidote protein
MKAKTQTTPFDPAEYLDNEEVIAAYLSEAIQSGEPELMLSVIGNIAKARGMTQVAKASGLGRESLYKALSPGAKPRFDTIMKVLAALNLQMSATAAQQ